MIAYILLAATVVASHLCRMATTRGFAAFRFLDKPLAALAVFWTILIAGDLGKMIEGSQWWAWGEGHTILNGVLYVGLALLVIFILLPPPYSSKKISEQDAP
jgi:hypothetical protein